MSEKKKKTRRRRKGGTTSESCVPLLARDGSPNSIKSGSGSLTEVSHTLINVHPIVQKSRRCKKRGTTPESCAPLLERNGSNHSLALTMLQSNNESILPTQCDKEKETAVISPITDLSISTRNGRRFTQGWRANIFSSVMNILCSCIPWFGRRQVPEESSTETASGPQSMSSKIECRQHTQPDEGSPVGSRKVIKCAAERHVCALQSGDHTTEGKSECDSRSSDEGLPFHTTSIQNTMPHLTELNMTGEVVSYLPLVTTGNDCSDQNLQNSSSLHELDCTPGETDCNGKAPIPFHPRQDGPQTGWYRQDGLVTGFGVVANDTVPTFEKNVGPIKKGIGSRYYLCQVFALFGKFMNSVVAHAVKSTDVKFGVPKVVWKSQHQEDQVIVTQNTPIADPTDQSLWPQAFDARHLLLHIG